MPCRFPPPLSPDQLTAALDGTAESQVYHHLDRCSSCSARLEHARRLEHMLKTQIPKRQRSDCPSPQRLGDYHLGLLSPGHAQAIRQHLTTCPYCSTELAELREFMAADPPPPPPARRPWTPPAVLRPPQWTPLRARIVQRPSALALRNVAAPSIVAEAAGTTITLDIDPHGTGQFTMFGQVMAEADDPWLGALVEVRQEGVLRAIAPVGDLGTFQCGPLHPAMTEVRITAENGHSIVLPDVPLGEKDTV